MSYSEPGCLKIVLVNWNVSNLIQIFVVWVVEPFYGIYYVFKKLFWIIWFSLQRKKYKKKKKI